MEREPMQDLVTHHDAADGFAFTASACRGAVRLRATGRRMPAADHHQHKLFVRLVLDCHDGRRVLGANRSGSAADFLDMGHVRRAKAVARMVTRARFPPGCADVVERFCTRAAARGRDKLCDDVTVAVVWRPRPEVMTAASTRSSVPCVVVAVQVASVLSPLPRRKLEKDAMRITFHYDYFSPRVLFKQLDYQ